MSDFKKRLYAVRRNPGLMQNLIYSELDRQMNKNDDQVYDIPDGTIPFVFAMECGVTETVVAIDEMEALSRKMYSRLAINEDDVYRHMSDDDYIGRFAMPSKGKFKLLLSYDEVISKVKAVPGESFKKLTLPRLTEFTIVDTAFTMQYPIEIKLMRHGGLQIEYVADKISPVEKLVTNIVDWEMLIIDRRKIIALNLEPLQFKALTFTDTLSPSVLFQATYSFNDEFFHARAYIDKGDGVWEEVRTTHSDLTYDPMVLTVVFKVVGSKLQVSIPTMYTFTSMAVGTIRIDIYTTKGELDLDLGNYRPNQFTVNLNAIDDDATYTTPLGTLSLIQAMSIDRVVGGAGALDFLTLRDRVINNTFGANSLPITDVQLNGEVERLGYTLVSNIDNITNRQFIASRRLSKPSGLDLVSGAGSTMGQLNVSLESLIGSRHCNDNGDRITIRPSMLYRFNDGKVTPMLDTDIDRIMDSGSEAIAREVNAGRMLYSPFHSVLDITNGGFEVRPYYLDNPVIKQKTFVMENDSAGLQVAIDTFDISVIETGYRIVIRLESSEAFKKIGDSRVICQLGYRPEGESKWCSMNGEYLGLDNGERVFIFDIDTNYDIDSFNKLKTTNLSMFSKEQRFFSTGLISDFDITVIVADTVAPDYQPNELDQMLQLHLLPQRFMAVTRERLTTTLGYDMSRLWRRARPVLGAESYLRWDHDVPLLHEVNVYETDVNGNVIIEILPDGELDYTLLHTAGDPVLDKRGLPVFKYRKGDVKRDLEGNPILVELRKRLYEITLFMLDGIFYFVSDRTMLDYKKGIPMEIVSWLQGDIAKLDKQLLEQCEMYLYPTTTYGDTIASVREGQRSTVTIDQGITVTLYLTPTAYANDTMRPSLRSNGKNIINTYFGRKSVSVSDIVSKLKETSGEGVVAIEVSGLGGVNNFSILTLEDDSVRLALRKKLIVLANQDLTVEDDIQFNFLKHELLQI